MRMTREAIRSCIRREELRDDPGLCERLHLQNRGFAEIDNLEGFTQLAELFLEGNALTKIDGLDAQKRLRSLHIQKNRLERMQNLDHCPELEYIDASNNFISEIDDLSNLRNLESLIVSQNRLSKPNSIRNVVGVKWLRELDLSRNRINCPLGNILDILSQCKSLRILRLKGNPITKSTHYRKLVISACKKLTRLDDNPICREERRRCDSWGRVVASGGSFDEADEADRRELNKLRMKISEANALRRGSGGLHCRQDDSTCSTAIRSSMSRRMSGGAIGSIMRSFGLTKRGSALPSHVSLSSRRDLDPLGKDVGKSDRGGPSAKAELQKAQGIAEQQRNEINHLRLELAKKRSKEEYARSLLTSGAICYAEGVDDDSEREEGYYEQLVQKAGMTTAADMQCF